MSALPRKRTYSGRSCSPVLLNPLNFGRLPCSLTRRQDRGRHCLNRAAPPSVARRLLSATDARTHWRRLPTNSRIAAPIRSGESSVAQSVRADASLAVQLLQDYLGLSLDRYAVDDVGPLLPPIRCQCDMNNVTVSSICAKDPLTHWVGCLDVPFVHVFIAPSGTVCGKFGAAQLK